MFVEYFKDAILAAHHPFPVSVKWTVRRSEEERRALRAKRIKSCVWAVLSGPDRHDTNFQREALQGMAAEWVSKFTYQGEMEFLFDVDCAWFEVLDDLKAETVKLQVVRQRE